MSQLLLSKTTSNLLNRTFILQTKPATNTTLPFINHYAHHLHPLPIIKLSPQIPTQIRTYYQRKTLTESYPKRIADNVSKMYARRMLFLAALSASNMASKTRMESSFIAKPKEWSTVDLEKQRREFGENISSLGSTKLSRVWAAGSRLFNLALLATPLTILAPLAYITGPQSKTTDYTWNYALWSIEKAGPTFIKLIQWATTRHDLFHPEFITRFSTLQDNTRGHSWKETKKALEESWGPNYHEVIDFDNGNDDSKKRSQTKSYFPQDKVLPIGSGCVAQVYKARLKKGVNLMPAGTEIAIKVTHPNILHKVCVDFYILNIITSWLEKIPFVNLDYLSMKDSVEQFRDIMLPQLDLRVEANNLKRFRRDFQNDPHVAFPLPIDDLTSDKVLVESFIHGETILKFCEEGRRTLREREHLARIGLEAVMKMIFLNDFVHGDLHPGNIIVNKNPSARDRSMPWMLNMIDCGLIVEMGEKDHVNLVRVLGAFVKKDGILAGELMIDAAKKCQASKLDMELFCKGIQGICDCDEDQNFLESVGDYLADICYLACKHKVKLEASFINAALACEIMEGIASKLYPTLAVQHIALPMVFKAETMHRLNETFGLKHK